MLAPTLWRVAASSLRSLASQSSSSAGLAAAGPALRCALSRELRVAPREPDAPRDPAPRTGPRVSCCCLWRWLRLPLLLSLLLLLPLLPLLILLLLTLPALPVPPLA